MGVGRSPGQSLGTVNYSSRLGPTCRGLAGELDQRFTHPDLLLTVGDQIPVRATGFVPEPGGAVLIHDHAA